MAAVPSKKKGSTVMAAGQKLLAFSLEERMKDCEEARRVDHFTGKSILTES